MHYLNLDTWNRREHFDFFSRFEEPFFGVCVELDCSLAYQRAKELQSSFFLYYLHASMVAANEVEPFRYRIAPDHRVAVYDAVHASSTVGRPDGTFGFSFIPHHPDFRSFEVGAKAEVARVRAATGLCLPERRADVLHYTALPWLAFTSMSHARSFSAGDSVPKIAFGQVQQKAGRRVMPVSIHVHHALMDALHISQFVDKFQQLLNG